MPHFEVRTKTAAKKQRRDAQLLANAATTARQYHGSLWSDAAETLNDLADILMAAIYKFEGGEQPMTTGIQIHNYDSGDQPGPGEKTWDTKELQEEFQVLSFYAPFVLVRRKADGVEGNLQFTHSPRVYFGFTEAV